MLIRFVDRDTGYAAKRVLTDLVAKARQVREAEECVLEVLAKK